MKKERFLFEMDSDVKEWLKIKAVKEKTTMAKIINDFLTHEKELDDYIHVVKGDEVQLSDVTGFCFKD